MRVLDDFSSGHRAYLVDVPHRLIEAPLHDAAAVSRAVEGVDVVVHLAARSGIPFSVANPIGSFDVNVAQSLAILDAVRVAGIPRFIFASSNAALGDHEPPADETKLPHPISPYGASKLAVEAYCQAYAATFGVGACILRFSNAYGPFAMHVRGVVATCIRKAMAGEPITIFGDGEQTRDFVYSGDLAAAVCAAIDAPAEAMSGQIFQVGTGRETSVNELVAAIGQALGTRLEVEYAPGRPGDVRRNVSRIDKAADRLGYQASVALEDGLDQTARWFRGALADPLLSAITPHAASGSD